MAKKRKKIIVLTHPNGYELRVGGKEYMTFNEETLLAAIFTHVGCGIDKFLDMELSKNLLTAAASWPTAGDAIDGNAQLMTQIEDAKREARVTRKQLNNLNDRYEALDFQYKDLKQLYALTAMKADKYDEERKKADESYELYAKECRKVIKLNRRIEALEHELRKKKDELDKKLKIKPAKDEKSADGATTPPKGKKAHRSRKDADALILKKLGIN